MEHMSKMRELDSTKQREIDLLMARGDALKREVEMLQESLDAKTIETRVTRLPKAFNYRN